MAQTRPTEVGVVKSVAALITGIGLPLRVVPFWVLGFQPGDVVNYLTTMDTDGTTQVPTNVWVLTTAAWIPESVKTQLGRKQTPFNSQILTPGYDEMGEPSDIALTAQKILVNGLLKVWQLVQYKQGDNDYNSEYKGMLDRQAVIDKVTASPRLGLEWASMSHDQLKFPAISQIPFNDSLLHIAQGNLPFSFTYVVTAA